GGLEWQDKAISFVSAFDIGPGDAAAILGGGSGEFPVLYYGEEAELELLDNSNQHTATWQLPRSLSVTWKAPDNTEVHGLLEVPSSFQQGDKLPLVVGLHGGPTTATKSQINYDPHNGRLYFAAHGYAALFPNYRGSTGYGDKFVTDLIGHEN